MMSCNVCVQSSPHRRDERPISCYTPASNSLQLSPASLSRDARDLVKDKQRFVPNLVNNETYGTIINTSSPVSLSSSAPPLPPRNLGTVLTVHSDHEGKTCYWYDIDFILDKNNTKKTRTSLLKLHNKTIVSL